MCNRRGYCILYKFSLSWVWYLKHDWIWSLLQFPGITFFIIIKSNVHSIATNDWHPEWLLLGLQRGLSYDEFLKLMLLSLLSTLYFYSLKQFISEKIARVFDNDAFAFGVTQLCESVIEWHPLKWFRMSHPCGRSNFILFATNMYHVDCLYINVYSQLDDCTFFV